MEQHNSFWGPPSAPILATSVAPKTRVIKTRYLSPVRMMKRSAAKEKPLFFDRAKHVVLDTVTARRSTPSGMGYRMPSPRLFGAFARLCSVSIPTSRREYTTGDPHAFGNFIGDATVRKHSSLISVYPEHHNEAVAFRQETSASPYTRLDTLIAGRNILNETTCCFTIYISVGLYLVWLYWHKDIQGRPAY